MICAATNWIVTQLRDFALSALGIREDMSKWRRVSVELEEFRDLRQAYLDLTCPPMTAAEVAGLVDVEAVTERAFEALSGEAWPMPATLTDVECVEMGVVTRPSKGMAQVAGKHLGDEYTQRCTHRGIGLPMCMMCDPRTKSEGGPRPDPVEDEPTQRFTETTKRLRATGMGW